jgi:hypothetical protein
MKAPDPETVRVSALSYLRQIGADDEADVLGRSKLELSPTAQRYSNTTDLGLRFTLRCAARDLPFFENREFGLPLPSDAHTRIKEAVAAVLPSEFTVHDLAARSVLVDRDESEKSELERLIETQKNLMMAVATRPCDGRTKISENRRDVRPTADVQNN